MKKKFLISLLLVIAGFVNAQKVHISVPHHAGKEYAFILSKGIDQDTIQAGSIPVTGDLIINIPEKDKDYKGMGSLQILGERPFNMIVNHENFRAVQDVNGKYTFENSSENNYLYSIIQDRQTPVSDSTLYASWFIGLIQYMQQLNKVVTQGGSLMEKSQLRIYALNNLDIDNLYTSSLWYHVVDGITKLGGSQEAMAEDMVRILKRIKKQEVFVHLVNNLIVITNQYGWDDAFDVIIPYVEESGRIDVPQGQIYEAFALAKVRRGTLAPQLKGLFPSLKDGHARRTLLVFYQPDCDNCHLQLEQIIKEYPKLKEQGVRIVTISSDTKSDLFKQDVKRFPWVESDNLCDFKGFAGENFLSYGIMGTPTFFLLDEDAKVIKRYAIFTDIDFSSSIVDGNEEKKPK